MTERRRLAVDLFNHAWSLLRLPERTPEQDDELIHAAHASRHHWAEVGTAANLARGEWQVSRVYATLGRAEPALHHAERCLDRCLAHAEDMEQFDLPYAYEALARAHTISGDRAQAEHYLALARQTGAKIEDADDRELLVADLDALTLTLP